MSSQPAITGSITDPEFRRERARLANKASRAPKVLIRQALAACDDPEAWAESIAAGLPPLTDAQAAGIGKLAALLDARHASPRTRPPGQSPRYSDTGEEADQP